MQSEEWMIPGFLICVAVCLACYGCASQPDTPMEIQAPQAAGRVSVTRIGVIKDDLAYGKRRGIYLIRDSETEAEFIGISGIGISELGEHSVRNGSDADER